MTARERLALQGWRARYSAQTIALMAHLTLRCAEVDRLDDRQIEQTTDAVEVCAQAGLDHEGIISIARYSVGAASGREDWRVRCWSRILAVANRRAAAPELYGLSPCDRPVLPPVALSGDLADPVATSRVGEGGLRCP